MVEAYPHQLTDPQAMAITHQQQGVIAEAIAPLFGGLEQPSHFGFGEEVLSSRVGGLC